MREIGAVDDDDKIRPRSQREIGRLAYAFQNGGDAWHHFAQTHDRSRIEREKAFQTLRAHGWTAHTHDAHAVASDFFEARHQLRAQLIARWLARHQHDGAWLMARARFIH